MHASVIFFSLVAGALAAPPPQPIQKESYVKIFFNPTCTRDGSYSSMPLNAGACYSPLEFLSYETYPMFDPAKVNCRMYSYAQPNCEGLGIDANMMNSEPKCVAGKAHSMKLVCYE